MVQSETHILILSSWLPSAEHPFLGNFIERQALLLSKKYRVTIVNTISLAETKEIIVSSSDNGYTLINSFYPRKKNPFLRKYFEKKALNRALNVVNKVDVIIGAILLPKGWQFIRSKKKLNAPLIYVEHGSFFRKEALDYWRHIDFFQKRQIERYADSIVAVSDFLKRDMQLVFDKSKIDVIGNHVDLALFDVKPKKVGSVIQFLHVSTLDPQTKNVQGIIDACEILKSRGKAFELTIVSDEDYSTWQEKVENKGLTNEIRFVGPLKWEEVAQYYHEADAFILNSTYETFSIVVAEAWATGTPVISTPVGIARELPSTLGMQINLNDPLGLAEAMINFDPSLFNVETIRYAAKQFDGTLILDKWITKIESIGKKKST